MKTKTKEGKSYNVKLTGREMEWIEQQEALHGTPYQRSLEDSVKQRIARETKKAATK